MKKPVSGCNGGKIPGKNAIRQPLRQVAEARLSEREVTPELTGGTPEQQLHELRVNKIELEMQNEGLVEAMILLEETRDKYMDLYDFAPVGYLIFSERAVIMEANLTAANLLGIERNKLIRKKIREVVAHDDLERWDQYFQAVLHSPEKITGQLKFMKAEGTLIDARLESIRLVRDNSGSVIRLAISIINDYVKSDERLTRKSPDLCEPGIAYEKIDSTQEQLKKQSGNSPLGKTNFAVHLWKKRCFSQRSIIGSRIT